MNDMTPIATKCSLVEVRPTSGLPEFLPNEQIDFNFCTDVIRKHYELAGAVPLQTPAFERVEVLTAKEGGDSVDRQIYGVARLPTRRDAKAEGAEEPDEDDSSPETGFKHALRFDLTVPLARYTAQNAERLTFPFRRYQIQPVWRGERSQSGRYREFVQADIDVLGDGELDILTDAEMVAITSGIFREMKIGAFVIRLSNRKLLEGFLSSCGVPPGKTAEAMRIVDKLDKVGMAKVAAELATRLGLAASQTELVIRFVSLRGRSDDVVERLKAMAGPAAANEQFVRGLQELEAVAAGVKLLGVPEQDWGLDLSVARGLSYYTGTVYETTLVDHPGIGSICSGGRYDNLASLFTARKLPGVGISIGVTRLISRLIEAGILKGAAATLAPVLVTSLDRRAMDRYLAMTGRLRNAGIGAEPFLENQRLGQQLRYASRKGFRFALIAGETEFAQGRWMLKDLVTGEQSPVADADIEISIAASLKHPSD